MSIKWYYSNGDNVVGPLSASDMRQAAGNGQIHSKTVVRRGDTGPWVAASKVKGLLSTENAPVVSSFPPETKSSSVASEIISEAEEVVEAVEVEEICEVEVIEEDDDAMWSDSSLYADNLPAPLPIIVHRPKKRSSPPQPKQNNVGLFLGLVAGGFGLIACITVATLFATGTLTIPRENSDSDHLVASKPQGETARTASRKIVSTKGDALSEAREKLNVSLDSWVFGDSPEKFKLEHPDIAFLDLKDFFRESVLMRYEVTNSRPKNFHYDEGWHLSETFHHDERTYQGFEFSVVLIFSAKNGQEIKESRNYGVHNRVHRKDGQWLVSGNAK